jgi:spherulation-specific family 4 protein
MTSPPSAGRGAAGTGADPAGAPRRHGPGPPRLPGPADLAGQGCLAGQRPRLGVPAYFHPAIAPDDWRMLTLAGPGAPVVVLNPASGPGQAPDPGLAIATRGLARAGARVLGYVDTAYGSRRATTVLHEVSRYRSWYGLTGVFLDQASSGGGELPMYGALAAAVRQSGMTLVALGHGVYPDPRYTVLADVIVAFEGPWSACRGLRVPAWAAQMPAPKFWHLVYDVPRMALGEAARLAVARNAGVVYLTDRGGANPWDGLASYFPLLAGLPGPCGGSRERPRRR